MSSRFPIASDARLATVSTMSARIGTPLASRTPIHAGISRECAIDSMMRAPVIIPETIVEKKSSAITAAIALPTAVPKSNRAATPPMACIGFPSASSIAAGSMTRR